MMLRHIGWEEALTWIIKGMEGAISAGTVTYDFERLMEGTLLSCSGFGDAPISHMRDGTLKTMSEEEIALLRARIL